MTVDGFAIRPAREDDQALIRHMVRQARLDPTQLHWPQFLVAEHTGTVIGIGQVRPGGRELGSMVVREDWRGRGVGGRLIEALKDRHGPPLYLESEGGKGSYYARFGFEMIPWYEAQGPLRWKAGIGTLLGRLFGFEIAVMRWDG